MLDISCVISACPPAFFADAFRLSVTVLFGVVAAFAFYSIARGTSIRSKIRWSYVGVFSILFIITYFAFSMTCHQEIPICTEQAFLYSIPLALIGSLFFGYVILPHIYLAWQNVRPAPALIHFLPSPVPIYIADNGKPFACSYGGLKKWIVISQGMIEILTKKELAAVVLHEYGHIIRHSSFYSLSGSLYRNIPFLQSFFDKNLLEDQEERFADSYAARLQGTKRHVLSAKKKLDCYFCS